MFIKFPKIKILGDKSNEGILTTPGRIVVQEKVDGANFGFYVENDILHFCSHNQNLTDSEQIEKTGIPKNWRGIEPVLKSWENDPNMFNADLYYYGESMQKHTIKYDDIPGFIGYDILNINDDKFLDYRLSKNIFKDLGLSFVNIIAEIDTEIFHIHKLDYLKSLYQKSAYKSGSAEGIVIKRYDTQQFAKIVDDDFKEKNYKIFIYPIPQNPKMTDDVRITEIYATPARIEKMIYKLYDNGYEIEMAMMRTLYIQVVKDILEEEILEIYSQYKSINFRNLNNLISKKCAKTLKNVIMSNENL